MFLFIVPRIAPAGLLVAKPVAYSAQRRFDRFQAVFLGVCAPSDDAAVVLNTDHAVLPDEVQ